MRVRLARAVRSELEARKHRMAVMTYDDLLTRLDAALQGTGGQRIAARLRARYDVVLVDEFQDTDPVQWDIMRRAFGETGGTLVLIADPKQAIYAFRGADVYAYLEAAQQAGERATLAVNWRSDQGLIDAYDALFADAKLGHEGIVYRRVRAADADRSPSRLGAPLRFRVARTRLAGAHPHRLRDQPLRARADRDRSRRRRGLAALLRCRGPRALGAWRGARPQNGCARPTSRCWCRPTGGAALIRSALEHAGIPAVINGAGSVFATDAARDWLRLLEALERPASTARAHTAALTCFLGFSPERAATADEDVWEEVHRRLYDWARVLRVRGVASLLETITVIEGLPQRILRLVDGERMLTDLGTSASCCTRRRRASSSGRQRSRAGCAGGSLEADEDTGDEERSRRLESDAEAVQVLTIHRSKGLEFPIVYLPFLWEPGYIPQGSQPVFFHDPEAGDQRTIDVATRGGRLLAPSAAICAGAARRGSPAGLRGADPRAPPGGRLVGGLMGQPQQPARAAPVRA